MPEESLWERFFDVPAILHSMDIDPCVNNVAELGCGYGTFTIPTAKLISGQIFAIDIERDLVSKIIEEGEKAGLTIIIGITRDFVMNGTGLEDGTVDYVMLFNILHAEKPIMLLEEAQRIICPDGKLGIIHWNYDSSTPRGPPMAIRPQPMMIKEWAEGIGFRLLKWNDLKPYHYGMVFNR